MHLFKKFNYNFKHNDDFTKVEFVLHFNFVIRVCFFGTNIQADFLITFVFFFLILIIF